MGSTQFGNFHNLCRDSTLPICNNWTATSFFWRLLTMGLGQLFSPGHNGTGFGGCDLQGIPLSGGRHLTNIGSILLCGAAIAISMVLLLRSEHKQAAVGRREIQIFLLSYIVVEICEIFSVGGIPLPENVRLGFTAVHIGAIAASAWILFLNGIVGYQLLDDGTAKSIGMVVASAVVIFIGTGYIALDTGFNFISFWHSTVTDPNNRNVALFVLYLIFPLLCIVVFFLLEGVLVLKVLGEKKPMLYLIAAIILFAIGQIFQFVVSKYICTGTSGKIDGALFETLFTLLAVVMTWTFWSSITEDDWPVPSGQMSTYPP